MYYDGKIKTNFHNDKRPKESSQCIFLSVILVDFVFKPGKNYYLLVFLKECKYVIKEKKMLGYITVDIKVSSDDSDRECYDYSLKENSVEERNFE